MTIGYIRVSSETQNLDRQRVEIERYFKLNQIKKYQIISEKISGCVPSSERKFNIVFNDTTFNHLVIEDVDRLGRNVIDILQTIEKLLSKNINVTVLKYGQSALLKNGQRNPIFQLLVSMMGTFGQMEREKIKERQKQGIEIAKLKGKYKGRKQGTTESKNKFLAKYKNVVRLLNCGLPVRKTAAAVGVSVSTVMKVKSHL